MASKPTTRRTKAASVASAYAGRQQSCATPRLHEFGQRLLPRLLLDVQRQA